MFFVPTFDGMLVSLVVMSVKDLRIQASNAHIKIANNDLVSIQVVANNKSRNLRVHNPVKHSRILINNWPKICIEVNRHHGISCGDISEDGRLDRKSSHTGHFSFALNSQALSNPALGAVASYHMPRSYLVYFLCVSVFDDCDHNISYLSKFQRANLNDGGSKLTCLQLTNECPFLTFTSPSRASRFATKSSYTGWGMLCTIYDADFSPHLIHERGSTYCRSMLENLRIIPLKRKACHPMALKAGDEIHPICIFSSCS